MREVPIPAHITILFVEQEVSQVTSATLTIKLNLSQVIGDETSAIDSVLKADVWRDHLMKEQKMLDTKLTELDAEGDEKRFEDAREDLSSRLAEVHTRLAEMDAASGPARAASLLAGMQMQHIFNHLLWQLV